MSQFIFSGYVQKVVVLYLSMFNTLIWMKPFRFTLQRWANSNEAEGKLMTFMLISKPATSFFVIKIQDVHVALSSIDCSNKGIPMHTRKCTFTSYLHVQGTGFPYYTYIVYSKVVLHFFVFCVGPSIKIECTRDPPIVSGINYDLWI